MTFSADKLQFWTAWAALTIATLIGAAAVIAVAATTSARLLELRETAADIAVLSTRLDDQRREERERYARMAGGSTEVGFDVEAMERLAGVYAGRLSEACEGVQSAVSAPARLTEDWSTVSISIACEGSAARIIGALSAAPFAGERISRLSFTKAGFGSDRVRVSFEVIRPVVAEPAEEEFLVSEGAG